MLTNFFESLGGKLAEQWAIVALTPAFVFWAGGIVAWGWRHHWTALESWFMGASRLPTPIQVALLIGILMVILISATIEQQFELPVLRLLEGYWQGWLWPLRLWQVRGQDLRFQKADQRFQDLAQKMDAGTLTAQEREEYVKLDSWLRRAPAESQLRMPTRLGNILRAAERWPADKYGLDAVICWPRLWLLLPDEAKSEISQTRARLDAGARVWFWSILFLVWTIWAWWTALSVLIAYLAYWWMLSAAETYADLLESAFDVHRTVLYKALRWPLPGNPSEERERGRQLTEYLWRGSDSPSISFMT